MTICIYTLTTRNEASRFHKSRRLTSRVHHNVTGTHDVMSHRLHAVPHYFCVVSHPFNYSSIHTTVSRSRVRFFVSCIFSNKPSFSGPKSQALCTIELRCRRCAMRIVLQPSLVPAISACHARRQQRRQASENHDVS